MSDVTDVNVKNMQDTIIGVQWNCNISLSRDEVMALAKMAMYSPELSKYLRDNWGTSLPGQFGSGIESAFKKFVAVGNADYDFRKALEKMGVKVSG